MTSRAMRTDGGTDEIYVLHVDDTPGLADLTAAFLKRNDEHIDVRTATSVDEGLDLIAEYEIDCVVSDYEMPGRNGIEFLEAVREEHPHLPFILFTRKGSQEIVSEAISAGASDFLQKQDGTDQYAVLADRIRELRRR